MIRADLRASVIYAGIEIARRTAISGAGPVAAVRYLKQGEAYLTSLNYDTALCWIDELGEDTFLPLDDAPAFRHTIAIVARRTRPPWVDFAPLGSKKVFDVLDADAIQCFRIAGLNGDSFEAVAWWDELAGWSRASFAEQLLQIGREGERLSMAYETHHLVGTDLTPRYIAIEDNTAGYDVLTWRPANLPELSTSWRQHHVEAKRSLGGEAVHLSRGEWRFATDHADSWEMQVWVGDAPEPIVLTAEDLRPHIPLEVGAGSWERVVLPIDAMARAHSADQTLEESAPVDDPFIGHAAN